MYYTLVNKNLLIPIIEKDNNLNMLLQKMSDLTFNMNADFCSNIYIVGEDEIYFSKNFDIYIAKNNSITKYNKSPITKNVLTTINNFIINNKETQIKNNKCEEMDISIDIKKNKNILVEDNIIIKKKEPEPKSQEELELIKLIEDTMEIYQNEVRKMKNIETKIKIIDDNNKTLLKKKKEKTLSNFSKLKNDYHTYKNIINKKKIKEGFTIPSLFELKYDYFNSFLNDEKNILLIEKVEEINLDEVLNQVIELADDIKNLSDNYGKNSKKLNVKFDHSWEDMEIETEPVEMNNSKLGGR